MSSSAERSRRIPGALAVSLIVLTAFASVGFYRARAEPGYPLDDSWIHLTFARNLAAGDGFGANAGESTPGATAPLWVAMLAAGYVAGADHTVWPWLLGALCLAAAGILARALVLALAHARSSIVEPSALVCGICLASTAPLVWSSAGAMEVPLFSALVCGALLVFARAAPTDAGGPGRAICWGALCGLAALARPEGLVLAPILALCNAVERRSAALPDLVLAFAACALVYSPSVVFCLATSGRPLPNTFYAKTTALVAGAPDPAFLTAALGFFADAAPVALAAFGLGCVGVLARLRSGERVAPSLATLGFAASLPLAYAMMGRTYLFAELAGNFGRYLYPVLAPALAAGFAALADLLRGRRFAAPIGAAAMVAALAASVAGSISGAPRYAHNVRDINALHVAMVRSLASKLPAGALVAANDVGALAYFGEFRILDLIGIISTQTLDALERAQREGIARETAYRELLRDTRPDAIVVFPGWFRGTLQGLDTPRRTIERIVNPDNITAAGKQLVAWRLDWDP